MRVLSLAYKKPLLVERHKLLKRARFDVVSVSTETDALRALAQEQFDDVIIGYSVPSEVRDLIARKAKSEFKAGVIFLYRHSINQAELADAVLSVDGNPKTLVNAIQICGQRLNAGNLS